MFAALRREGKVFIPAGCVTPCARAATGCVVLPGAGAAADTGTDPAVTGRGQLQPAEPFAISGRGFLKPSCAFCLFSLAGVSSALCAGSWLGRMGWDSWDASTEIMKAEHPRLFVPFPRPRVPIFMEHTFTLTRYCELLVPKVPCMGPAPCSVLPARSCKSCPAPAAWCLLSKTPSFRLDLSPCSSWLPL